jgi:hypothetical protein
MDELKRKAAQVKTDVEFDPVVFNAEGKAEGNECNPSQPRPLERWEGETQQQSRRNWKQQQAE